MLMIESFRKLNERMIDLEKKEYEEIVDTLKRKLKKGYTNKEDGYNEGILCAISKVRSVYKATSQSENE